MSKKKKSGYDILKEKVAKLEAENAKLHTTISMQSGRISELNAEAYAANCDCIKQREADKEIMREMLKHMGWWRRTTWFLDHKKPE